jgi:hypothetical protein
MATRIEITQEQLEAVDALVQYGSGRKQYFTAATRLGLNMSGFTLYIKHRAWVNNGKMLAPKPDRLSAGSLHEHY